MEISANICNNYYKQQKQMERARQEWLLALNGERCTFSQDCTR